MSSEDQQQSADSPSGSTPAPSSATSSILKDRRFKLSRACDRCRRRRIKCDEGHPCQSCLNSSSACTFEEPGKRTHPHKSKRTSTLEDRMHHLETLIQAIPPAVFAAGGVLGNPPVPSSPIDPASNAHASFASSKHDFPAGVPPPSLSTFPLMNPSTYFAPTKPASRQPSPNAGLPTPGFNSAVAHDHLADDLARMSLSASYLYFDDEGYTRWQGETSGLPLLDLLVERHRVVTKPEPDTPVQSNWSLPTPQSPQANDWFPGRTARRTNNNPEVVWKLVTSVIAPDLMDSLVQCYLSTSYYLMPFLHVPSFLADYGNPHKWGEPGFAAFIVAICCLSSRHIDDPRVRADPADGNTAGTTWFELFGRLRTLPTADRPTIYTVQSVLIAGVYAVGLGKLSKAFALISEAITLSIDSGLHRSADAYDVFDAIEDEVRKRTFWCVYMWDKQACVHFGRPPMIRLRDCDIGEPAIVDDEYITPDAIGPQPPEIESRMGAFINCVRIFIVLESILDVPPSRNFGDGSPFLTRATSILTGFRRHKELREEEALLDEIVRAIPAHWAHSVETMSSEDVLRVTQAERLHCAEQFVRMLIYRHRFSEMVAEKSYRRISIDDQSEAECEAMRLAHSCAMQIVSSHLHITAKGLMTYYGVHVIHQLTAAGRTLVAVLLNCHSDQLRPLIAPALDALRSCVGLLRRFSGRYVCGQRSGDLMEEFCRITKIPLESNSQDIISGRSRPPWIRPVRKKASSVTHSAGSNESPPPNHGSPEGYSPSADTYLDLSGGNGAATFPSSSLSPSAGRRQSQSSYSTFRSASNGPPRQRSFNGMDTSSSNAAGAGDLNGGLSLQPADLLSIFGDGSVDMSALLMSPGLNGQHHPSTSDFYASLAGSSMDVVGQGGGTVDMVSP
ncbi:fungal-specific transcription factor domain-containing protein [Cristinia sonorae]|uniref:Fungal-specific transcription factor domain-containing protein n=1 Tax=Cristinia sonorae TaxID=1940300 RepID=A0A8K0XK39_9AGAR|nr:fungal-specific transcription factor domain-containing protein [Cristinia sonorae]